MLILRVKPSAVLTFELNVGVRALCKAGRLQLLSGLPKLTGPTTESELLGPDMPAVMVGSSAVPHQFPVATWFTDE